VGDDVSGVWRAVTGQHRHLLTGSAWLVVTLGINGVSGVLFWLAASHLYDKTQVGVASALVSSVVFLAFLAALGLPVTLARFGHDRDDADRVLRMAVVGSTSVGAVGATIYVEFVHAPATAALGRLGGLGGIALMAALVAGASLALVVDVRLMIDRRWNLVVLRAVSAAALRFPLIAVLPRHRAEVWLLVANAGPPALSGVVGIVALRPRRSPSTDRVHVREVMQFSLINYAATLVSGGAVFALPVIVLLSVSPAANANFYIAWGVVSLTVLVPPAIGQVLLVEGGRPGASGDQVRVAALIAVGVMALAALVTAVGKGVVVSIYGSDYRMAARILPALVLAGVPAAAVAILLTEARLHRDSVATIVMPAAATLAVLVPALFVVPGMGLDGAVDCWVGGNVAGMVIALGVRRYRRSMYSRQFHASISRSPGRWRIHR
jgi:O-antigen/teichoic acid export membrane protein